MVPQARITGVELPAVVAVGDGVVVRRWQLLLQRVEDAQGQHLVVARHARQVRLRCAADAEELEQIMHGSAEDLLDI